jgi:hypothetical protein
MDDIRELIKKPLVIGIAGLVVGIALGILYGWVIAPVKWTDAAVEHLRADLQQEYLRMAIDSYAFNQNADLAKKRFADVGPGAATVLEGIMESPGEQNPETILAYKATAAGGVEVVTTPGEEAQPEEEPAESAGSSIVRLAIPVMCLVFLIIAGAAFYVFIWRPRQLQSSSGPTPAMQAREAARQAEWTDYSAAGAEPPMVQFMSSYKFGDDLFDESFSIDSPAGEFLGECGVGISETVGVGEPKKVSAFEVWLFDKNDIQTVTKVMMSAHAFLDESSRLRLSAKGEPVLAEAGTETVLETQTLRLVARVVDLGYGEGPVPDSSFFDRLLLELAVWPKEV